MKKILAVYYSQTGQAKNILDNILKPIVSDSDCSVEYLNIEPEPNFPFPWTSDEFFNTFPESVAGTPCKLKPFNINLNTNFDLILISGQVWYLSPSIPVNSFLKTPKTADLLKNKPIITVWGTRNMWAGAQETVKKSLKEINAYLVGNIVLIDKHNNLTSVLTIIRWLMKGKKEKSFFLPPSGISENDISDAEKFGIPILNSLKNTNFSSLQAELLKINAVEINYPILKLEQNGTRIFKIWNKIITNRRKYGHHKRLTAIRIFKYYLLFVIFIISPIAWIFFAGFKFIFPKKSKNEISYYQNVRLKN
jgi:hypothetical protein